MLSIIKSWFVNQKKPEEAEVIIEGYIKKESTNEGI